MKKTTFIALILCNCTMLILSGYFSLKLGRTGSIFSMGDQALVARMSERVMAATTIESCESEAAKIIELYRSVVDVVKTAESACRASIQVVLFISSLNVAGWIATFLKQRTKRPCGPPH